MDRLQARYLAEAGIVKAREFLTKDKNEYDSLYECGIMIEDIKDIEQTPENIFGAESNKLGNGTFSVHYTRKKEDEEGENIQYGMIDEERKINIKLSNLEKLTNYKEILKRLSPGLTEEIINAIIDWQDGGDFDSVRSPGGAEDFDYEAEYGYSCKDADFETIEELLLVKGMTIDLFDEIKDYITVYTDGKININTAPKEVLTAVIDDGKGTYERLVTDIVNWRNGDDGVEGTSDDRLLVDRNAVLSLAKEDDPQGKNRLEVVTDTNHYFTIFKSSTFRIISHGKVRKITKVITCVVDRENLKDPTAEENPIKYYHEE